MQLAMINDEIINAERLDPIYFDRGTFFGDGVYEVVRSYNGRIFAFEDHLERFKNSMAAIKITAIDIETVRERALRAFHKAAIPNAKIYFHVTRGSAPRDHTWPENLEPNFFLTVSAVPDCSKMKKTGIAVCTHPDWRWKRCDIKSLNLLANVLARQYAAEKGCEEAILVSDQDLITEGAGSAFFTIISNTLHTTPLGHDILPSITRKYVLKAAHAIDLPVKEHHLSPEQAASADELFIAVTTKDIVPVVKFNDTPIANSKPGPLTRQLINQFQKITTP